MSLSAGTLSWSGHVRRVRSLYKLMLKNELDWVIERDQWYPVAARIRSAFDEKKSVKEYASMDKEYELALQTYNERKHPSPYILPWMPGGSFHLRYYPVYELEEEEYNKLVQELAHDSIEMSKKKEELLKQAKQAAERTAEQDIVEDQGSISMSRLVEAYPGFGDLAFSLKLEPQEVYDRLFPWYSSDEIFRIHFDYLEKINFFEISPSISKEFKEGVKLFIQYKPQPVENKYIYN